MDKKYPIFVVNETNSHNQTSIDQSKLTAFQQMPAVEKKPLARPTHLNLSLQDIFSQSEDISSNLPATSKSHISNGTGSVEKPTAELLSTPEGPLPPETSTSEDLKIHELLQLQVAWRFAPRYYSAAKRRKWHFSNLRGKMILSSFLELK